MRIDPEADRAMIADLKQKGLRGAWLDLIGEVLRLAGGKAELVHHSERPWASATFSGSRHTIGLVFTGEEAFEPGEDFVALLPEHEFSVRGQIVADATVTSIDQRSLPAPKMTVEAELLLLEDL